MTKQHKELLAAIIAVGQEFKPLHKKLTTLFTPEVRQQIETLKTEVFGVSAGLRGNLVAVGEDTHPTSGPKTSLTFYWDEFVSWCFGVSARRINQLLDTDEVRAERAEAKRLEDERVAAEEVKVYTEAAEAIYAANPHPKTDKEAAAALRVGWEKLKAVGGHDLNRVKMIDFCLNEIENPITPLGEGDELTQSIEAVGDNPHYERKDPYAYFEQFKAEPQTMGDEISAMLIEFGLDQHQIKEVLRYVEMSAKRTLNQMQTAVAA